MSLDLAGSHQTMIFFFKHMIFLAGHLSQKLLFNNCLIWRFLPGQLPFFDYCLHFFDIHTPWGTWVDMQHVKVQICIENNQNNLRRLVGNLRCLVGNLCRFSLSPFWQRFISIPNLRKKCISYYYIQVLSIYPNLHMNPSLYHPSIPSIRIISIFLSQKNQCISYPSQLR